MRPTRPSLAAAALLGALAACTTPLSLSKDDSGVVLTHQSIAASDPSRPGSHAVRTLVYGSGTDRRRAVFRDSVAIRTGTVDLSPFVSASPEITKDRRKHWGFGFDKMPINARVWYPDGDGPFPLVLIVHGNHDPDDESDPGYGYLGELLASRGFILASVDENFINGNLRGENDGRGVMLLEHLKVWRAFNDSVGRPFHHKVDLGHIALMGHSRGGEAVAIAAAFNRLGHYPDDATLKFDYGFDIRGIVAIAPIDGQYKPAGVPTPLTDVSYLVMHGSHDGDVSSFSGMRQYQRLRFTDGTPYFKTAVYVYRANHGQWNTVWGNQDNGPRSGRRLDLRTLLAPEQQRQMGKVYIGAFLEATLHDRREYLALFRDHRTAADWLPKTMYITRFAESGTRELATFDEDVDVATATARGATISAESLSTWRENIVPARWRDAEVGTNAVWLGWNNAPVGPDTTKPRAPASFTITLGDSLRAAWRVSGASSLVLSLAPTNDVPGPRKTDAKKDSSVKRDSVKPAAPGTRAEKKARPDSTPMDLTIELIDADGRSARMPLSRYGAVRRPLDVHILRRRGRDESGFRTTYELVLQTYVMPLADFTSSSGGFDPVRLRQVRLLFDRTRAGTVVMDDVGLVTAR
jgi:dienelactone hydrolase